MSDLSTELEKTFSDFKTNLDYPHEDFMTAISLLAHRAREVKCGDVYKRATAIKDSLVFFEKLYASLSDQSTTMAYKEEGLSMAETHPRFSHADLDAEVLTILQNSVAFPENPKTPTELQAWKRFRSEQAIHWSNRKEQERWPVEIFMNYAPLIRLKGMTSSKIPEERDYGVLETVINFDKPLSAAITRLLNLYRGNTQGAWSDGDSAV